jgi:hypothetical protein
MNLRGVNHFDSGAPGRGLLLFAFRFLLLQVVIPAMMLRPHNPRLEVVVVQQQFHLLHASPLWVYSYR